MERAEITAANARAWDEAAPYHARHNQERLLASFRTPGFSCLDATETALLTRAGIAGKRVAQLCCNNGRELLSLEALGARGCTGFDISAEFIAQANELKAAAGAEADFIASDIYEIGPDYDGAFDLIYISIGALCWMPDLAAFFAVAARLAAPGGQLFLYDKHPIIDMFEPGLEGEAVFTPVHSYFRREPFAEADGLDYWSGQAYEGTVHYSFPHPLSDVFNAVIGAGFVIRHFEEYAHDIAVAWHKYEERDAQFPLSYTLLASKAD